MRERLFCNRMISVEFAGMPKAQPMAVNHEFRRVKMKSDLRWGRNYLYGQTIEDELLKLNLILRIMR